MWKYEERTLRSCSCSSKMMDRLICTVCRLGPLRCFIFSCHLLFKRPEAGRTDGFYLEAFATIVFVCMLSMMLFNSGTYFRGTHKNKRRVDLLYNYADRGVFPCHACIIGVVSLLFVHTPITFCFYWLLSVSCIYLSRMRYIATFWTLIRLTFCFSFLSLLSLLKGLHVKDVSVFESLNMCLFL
jgi:hypothetical protein